MFSEMVPAVVSVLMTLATPIDEDNGFRMAKPIAVQETLKNPPRIDLDPYPLVMQVCRKGYGSNIPKADRLKRIVGFARQVEVTDKVTLYTSPVKEGCLISGFGYRRLIKEEHHRLHKGLDIAHPAPTPVYTAGAGVVLEAEYHHAYGNYLLIDHGDNVYTRYAHLDELQAAIHVGQFVVEGQTIGVMGTSADKPVGRHLHFEILTGNYDTRWGSYGLKPRDILRLPAHGHLEMSLF